MDFIYNNKKERFNKIRVIGQKSDNPFCVLIKTKFEFTPNKKKFGNKIPIKKISKEIIHEIKFSLKYRFYLNELILKNDFSNFSLCIIPHSNSQINKEFLKNTKISGFEVNRDFNEKIFKQAHEKSKKLVKNEKPEIKKRVEGFYKIKNFKQAKGTPQSWRRFLILPYYLTKEQIQKIKKCIKNNEQIIFFDDSSTSSHCTIQSIISSIYDHLTKNEFNKFIKLLTITILIKEY